MKINKDSVEVTRDGSNKDVMTFFAEDGSYWTYDQKKVFRKVFPSIEEIQDSFFEHLERHFPEKIKRVHIEKDDFNPSGKDNRNRK